MAPLYFAYGSNMEPRRFRRRAPGARALGPARLPGYRLDFTRYSTGFRGGVADVVPDAESEVWGVLFEVNDADLDSLDDYEGVPIQYHRERATVIDRQGQEREAVLYVANRTGHFTPRKEYMEILLRGARAHGLPEAWIRYLENIKTV